MPTNDQNRPVRAYNGKDVEMATIILVLVDFAIVKQAILVTFNTALTPDFLTAFRLRIVAETTTILGTDVLQTQRNATLQVLGMFSQAHDALAVVSLLLEAAFRTRPEVKKEILQSLGFTTFIRRVQLRDQEALANLLFQYRRNLTGEVFEKLIDANIAEDKLNDPLAFVTTFNEANVYQEGEKEAHKEITDEDILTLNALYNETMFITGVAKAAFQKEKAILERFSYTKLLSNLNRSNGGGSDDNQSGGNTGDNPPS